MTDFQKKKIRELRMRGAGYRAIASVVGLSRDIVRNYCKNHGLDGYANVLTVNMKEQMQQGKACLCCGKTIKQPETGRKRKFCSDKCRHEWWAVHPEAVQKKLSFTRRPASTVVNSSPFMAIGKENIAVTDAMYMIDFGEKKKEDHLM